MAPGDFPDLAVDTWARTCISLLPPIADMTNGLVNGSGLPMEKFSTPSTWGIDVGTCYQFCNETAIPLSSVFDFQVFANGFTNYLLPWLALTAQLPYETGSPWSNLMSFCMSVGSPALATYSLAMTILNRYWVRQRFIGILDGKEGVNARYAEYVQRAHAIEYLLSEGQQVPLRASQEPGWLSSLIVLPANQRWWTGLHARLASTRRGVTFSLVAQALSAVIAWLFVVISAFRASLGLPSVALEISTGSLWIWLLPVICGWIAVGTQYNEGTIRSALNDRNARLARPAPIQPDPPVVEERGTGWRRLWKVWAVERNIPRWCGANVQGDEALEGPIYNYARVFTWYRFASTLIDATEETMQKIDSGIRADGNNARWIPDARNADYLDGDRGQIAGYCGLGSPLAYPCFDDVWRDPGSRVFGYMATAGLIALFVQWGTSGAAIIISYLTPAMGLGCRSGAYIIYGSLGTAGWCFLLVSMFFSHAAMLRYQHVAIENPSVDFMKQSNSSSDSEDQQHANHPANGQDTELQDVGQHGNRCPTIHHPHYQRSSSHSFLCGMAVCTRILGKMIVINNALWIVLISLLEFIGVLDNCWCNGLVASKGDKGWVLLFKTAEDLKTAAQGSWAGGVTLGMLVVLCSLGFFFLGSRKPGASS